MTCHSATQESVHESSQGGHMPADTPIASAPSTSRNGAGSARHFDTLVIGAGFAGIGAAIKLGEAGFDDFAVLEKSDNVGGTWRDNTYPGCACDVPSHLYSYSFAPNPQWTHVYSRQPEIWAYLRDCAKRFDVMGHVRFGYELVSARWDGTCWRLNT